MDYFEESLKKHKEFSWKLETISKVPLKTREDLSTYYSPWVAAPCAEIAKDKKKVNDYTLKSNTIAVISDGTAVLWLWDIWPEASLPVMEWKAILFKEFWGINAFPIILNTKDTKEIIDTIKHIAPTFWWINLEDISSPRCFEIEETLKRELDIPVFHDDQHWTAIVTLAWIINALKITKKDKKDVKVLINWVWAAWVAITKLLHLYGIKDIVVVDSKWTIYAWRWNLNVEKEMLTNITNTACVLDPESKHCIKWWLKDAIVWRDIFIWVSAPWVLTKEMVKSMNKDPIIFAMANPIPEIMPEDAYDAWAKVVATWRSDYPNQLNNVLVFPWIFKWALQNKVPKITDEMKIRASENLANMIKNPTFDKIIPSPFDVWVADEVAKAIA